MTADSRTPSRLAELFNEGAQQGEHMDDCECYRYAAMKLNEELQQAEARALKYRRLYECAQNANSFRQQAIDGN